MDYDVMMNTGRSTIISYAQTHFDETVAEGDLDSIWTGNMMELNRVMFLDVIHDRIYVVTFDKLNNNAATVKVYSKNI